MCTGPITIILVHGLRCPGLIERWTVHNLIVLDVGLDERGPDARYLFVNGDGVAVHDDPRDDDLIIVLGIHQLAQRDLLRIRETAYGARRFPRLGKYGEKDRRENRDDCDD